MKFVQFVVEKEKYNLEAAILAYPVISLKEYTHEETARNFLGNLISDTERIKYSSHYRVDKNTVPTFIWTTMDDETVPYENTLMMREALDRNKIKNQVMIFPHGVHGLALADETAVVNGNTEVFFRPDIAIWFTEAIKFIKEVESGE